MATRARPLAVARAVARRLRFSAAILLFVVGEIVRPGFASGNGIVSVLVVASFVGFVAAGQCFVVLIGGIDLSVPWILNAAAIVLVTSTGGSDSRLLLGLVATLGMGAVVGALNGIGVALFGVPAVVMTLAMNGVMEGLTLGLTGGMTCEACASYAPPLVQAGGARAAARRARRALRLARHHPARLVRAGAHHVRAEHLCGRQQRSRELSRRAAASAS